MAYGGPDRRQRRRGPGTRHDERPPRGPRACREAGLQGGPRLVYRPDGARPSGDGSEAVIPGEGFSEIIETDIIVSYEKIETVASEVTHNFPWVQNLILHELGHHLGLAHSSSSELMVIPGDELLTPFKTMELEIDDDSINGIEALYPECF